MSLQRRRELARLSKPELIDVLIDAESTMVELKSAEGVAAIQAERELVEALETLGQLVQWRGLSWDHDALYYVRRALIECQAVPDTQITSVSGVE